MTKELLPCPFCGSSARVETEIDDDGFDVADEPERWVQCENRDCRGRSDWSYDPDMAVKWWNTRPSAQAVAVEELELLVIDLLACEGCGDPHNDSALGNLHAYIRRRGLGDALHEATHYPEEYDRKRKAALGGEK